MFRQNFSTGFEIEKLQTQDYECVNCLGPITNPICHECLGNHVLSWLGFYPNIKKKVQPKIREYVKDVNNNTITSVSCASCQSKKAALCPYCFTEGVFNLLKKCSVDKMVIMDFLSTFNFDLKHEGYIQDAIEQGLY